MNRKLSRLLVAWITAVTLLLSQLAVAGYECQRMAGMNNMPSTCEIKQATPSAICSAHCEKGAQLGSGSTNISAPTFSLIAWMQPFQILMSVISTDSTVYLALAPPLIFPEPSFRIQYQVFLI